MSALEWVFESGLIALLGGVYMLLLAYEKVPREPKNPEATREAISKHGTVLKILGLGAALGGLVRFISFMT